MAATTILAIEHIVRTPGVLGGRARVAGRRIPVWQIAYACTRGQSTVSELAESHELTEAQIHAALAYYYDHREEIEAEIAGNERLYEEGKRRALAGDPHVGATVTVAEVAQAYGIAPQTVREACQKGWIRARKSGATWLIHSRDACERWGRE
jgi:uncharacterized protein (DUF433 family)